VSPEIYFTSPRLLLNDDDCLGARTQRIPTISLTVYSKVPVDNPSGCLHPSHAASSVVGDVPNSYCIDPITLTGYRPTAAISPRTLPSFASLSWVTQQ